tara:strand:- start:681 stop:839 length:159 start_codon:yes stop_codon:yes gene_type:complete
MEIDKAYLIILVLSNLAMHYYSKHLAITDLMNFFDRHQFLKIIHKEENKNEK